MYNGNNYGDTLASWMRKKFIVLHRTNIAFLSSHCTFSHNTLKVVCKLRLLAILIISVVDLDIVNDNNKRHAWFTSKRTESNCLCREKIYIALHLFCFEKTVGDSCSSVHKLVFVTLFLLFYAIHRTTDYTQIYLPNFSHIFDMMSNIIYSSQSWMFLTLFRTRLWFTQGVWIFECFLLIIKINVFYNVPVAHFLWYDHEIFPYRFRWFWYRRGFGECWTCCYEAPGTLGKG